MEEIFTGVKSAVAETLGIDAKLITMESSFIDDLGADSLDIAELIIALEDKFGISISDEDALKIVRVKDAVEYVNNAKNNNDSNNQ